jgi:hypothetical protein
MVVIVMTINFLITIPPELEEEESGEVIEVA